MYNIRLVNGDKETTCSCRHYTVTRNSSFVKVETSHGDVFEIPKEGNAIYVMNQFGDTIDTFRRQA
jgi:hypothetical protein